MAPTLRHALPAGHRLDEYEIGSVLGHGGFGVTYLAHDRNLGTRVAIKEFLPGDLVVREDGHVVHPKSEADREEFLWGLERFLQEAQTLARFKHPNIVPVLRFFEANGTAYLVMEYQEGKSLAELLGRSTRYTEARLWPILVPLLDGLAEVHKAGFLHRDIKPGNIYIRADGSPVLLDFGAARQALGQKSKSLTAIVTAGYAPFEQYETSGNQGPWTDIYALGGVLYRAVTGAPPVEATTRASKLIAGDADPLVPAAEAGKGQANAKVLTSIDAALSFREKDRPQTVEAWRDMLLAAGDAASDIAVMQSSGRGGRPVTAGLVGFVAALLVVGGGFAAWQVMQDDTGDGGLQAQQASMSNPAQPGRDAKPGDETMIGDSIRRAEDEARKRAAEQASREAEAKRQAEIEAKRQAEQTAKAQAAADAEAKRKAEEEAQARAAADAERKAEAEAKRQAEQSAKAQAAAAAEAKRKAAADAADAKAKALAAAEAEAKRRAAEDAKRKKEIEARIAALERRTQEAEARAKAAETAKKAGGTAAPVQSARLPENSPAERLKKLFSGARASFTRQGRRAVLDFMFLFKPDGSLSGRWTGPKRSDSGEGIWEVHGELLCLQFKNWGSGKRGCYTVTGAGRNYIAVGPGRFAGSFVLER